LNHRHCQQAYSGYSTTVVRLAQNGNDYWIDGYVVHQSFKQL
jgi:hypothetical protein